MVQISSVLVPLSLRYSTAIINIPDISIIYGNVRIRGAGVVREGEGAGTHQPPRHGPAPPRLGPGQEKQLSERHQGRSDQILSLHTVFLPFSFATQLNVTELKENIVTPAYEYLARVSLVLMI